VEDGAPAVAAPMPPTAAEAPAASDMVWRLVEAVKYREHAHTHQYKSAQSDMYEAVDAIVAEFSRLRCALRAVRACTDPKWQAQLISDALRETP
jgi:hypothetical protein